jgi:hypothetical protein
VNFRLLSVQQKGPIVFSAFPRRSLRLCGE